MILANLWCDALDALHCVGLDLHVRVVELFDKCGADASLKTLLELFCALCDLVAEIVCASESDILVEVLTVFEHAGEVRTLVLLSRCPVCHGD